MKTRKIALAATSAIALGAAAMGATGSIVLASAPPASGGGAGDSVFVTLDDLCATFDGLQAPDGFSVNLVTDIGKVDDGTFNQFAYDGMDAANKCFGIEDTNFIETANEADYGPNIATSLEDAPNVLITVGFLLTDATAAAAAENPDVNFIGVDQFLPEYPANMAGEQFAEDEAGYVAGVLAATLSESDTVGVVAGLETVPPVVKFVNGLTAGASSVKPDINVLYNYNESFTDPSKGASDASQFIGEGADVIFGAGGQTGSGGIKAAAEQGVWAIGVDQDEYFTTFAGGSAPGSDKLVSSAMKRVDLATFQLIASAVQDDFQDGLFLGNAANSMIALAPPHDAVVPEGTFDAANEALAGLADGSITTGVCGIDGGIIADGGTACDAAPTST